MMFVASLHLPKSACSGQGIILHGSRGLAGGYRPDSDVDLSLIVSSNQLPNGLELDGFLRKVIETTLDYWQSTIEAYLAAIFDTKNCDLKCGFTDRGVLFEIDL